MDPAIRLRRSNRISRPCQLAFAPNDLDQLIGKRVLNASLSAIAYFRKRWKQVEIGTKKQHSCSNSALNEAETIGKIIQNLKQKMDVVVVDDGSTTLLLRLPKKRAILKTKTEGYEAALKSGLIWAKAQPYVFAITIDADDEIDPEHAFRVLNELKGGADLVVGRRHSFPRISESIFSIFAKFQWSIDIALRRRVTD